MRKRCRPSHFGTPHLDLLILESSKEIEAAEFERDDGADIIEEIIAAQERGEDFSIATDWND